MPDLFASGGGGVAYLSSTSPARLQSIALQGASAIGDVDILVTGLALSQNVKIAFFSTLGESLYIYPLGNEISKCVITGLALPASSCGSASNYTAAQKILTLYDTNKATNFANISHPLKVVMGPINLTGFIEGMTMEVSNDPKEFGFARFSIKLSIIPSS